MSIRNLILGILLILGVGEAFGQGVRATPSGDPILPNASVSYSMLRPNGVEVNWRVFPSGLTQSEKINKYGNLDVVWNAPAGTSSATVSASYSYNGQIYRSSLVVNFAFPCTSPTINFSSSVSSACKGQTYHFVTNPSTPYTSIIWNSNANYNIAITPNTGSKEADITFTGSGSIDVKATVVNDCGSAIASKTVAVTSPPAAVICQDCPAVVCEDTRRIFKFAYSASTTSWEWVLPSGVQRIGNNTLTPDVELEFSGTGTKTISVTPLNGTCSGPAYTFDVEVSGQDRLDEVTFGHQYLFDNNPNPLPKTLSLNGCNETTSSCTRTVTKLDLYARLNVGGTHNWGNTDFAVSGNFDIRAFNSGGTELFSRTIALNINKDNVEQLYHETFTANLADIANIEITPVANSYLTSGLVDPNDLSLSFYYTDEETIDVSAADIAIVSPSPGASINGTWEQTFSWKIANPDYCREVPNYEFQLIRQYGGEAVEWSQALKMYTDSGIPQVKVTIAEGSGDYKWRVRPVGSLSGGITNPANWSEGQWAEGSFTYTNSDDQKNWIYSRTFTEGNKISEQLTFANGLQQVQQQQTKVSGRVVATQTLQDYSGRNVISTLPVPLINAENKLGYKDNLISGGYAKSVYDNDPKMATAMTFTSPYYSAAAVEGTETINKGVAKANGYPYTRTVFTNDGTGRVKEQSGVGIDHRIGNGRSVRTYYSGTNESEMLMLFGDEAPEHANVNKITTFDANGTASITYQNKDGKVLATALSAGSGGAALLPLESDAITLYEYVGGGSQQGPFLQTTRKPLLFTKPRDIDITYEITPSMLSEICDVACRTCDYRIEIIMHTLNPIPGQPASTLLGEYDINMGTACSTNATVTVPVASFSAEAETEYILEKRVITNNTAGEDLTYLEQYINEEISKYKTSIDGSLQAILNYLTNKDTEGLRAYLVANYNIDTDGYYIIPVLCDENIRIQLPEICEPDPVAGGGSCTWEGNSLADYFNVYWAARPYNEAGDVYTVVDLFVKNRLTGEKEYFDASTFEQLMANVYTENSDVLSCKTIWNTWRGQVASYGAAIEAFKDISVEDEPDFVYEYVMVQDFINALEGTLLANLPAMPESEQQPCVEGAKTYFTRNNSDLYGIIGGQTRDFDITRAHAMVYYDEGDDADEDTQGLRYYFNHLLGQDETYKPALTDYTALTQCDRYKLSQGSQAIDPAQGEGDKEKYRLKAIGQCGAACEARSENFKQGIIRYLASVNPNVKIQHYEITTVDFITDTDTIKYMGIYDSLINDVVYDYSECDINAMVEALVQNCKDNYCQLDFWTNPLTGLEELGFPEQLIAMKQIYTHNFEVQVKEPGESCGVEYDYLSANYIRYSNDPGKNYDITEGFVFGSIAVQENPDNYDAAHKFAVTKTGEPSPLIGFDLEDPNNIGTLRWAVEKANQSTKDGSQYLIYFDLSTTPATIELNANLMIKNSIIIDGNTQPDHNYEGKDPRVKIIFSFYAGSISYSQRGNFNFNSVYSNNSKLKSLSIINNAYDECVFIGNPINNLEIIGNIFKKNTIYDKNISYAGSTVIMLYGTNALEEASIVIQNNIMDSDLIDKSKVAFASIGDAHTQNNISGILIGGPTRSHGNVLKLGYDAGIYYKYNSLQQKNSLINNMIFSPALYYSNGIRYTTDDYGEAGEDEFLASGNLIKNGNLAFTSNFSTEGKPHGAPTINIISESKKVLGSAPAGSTVEIFLSSDVGNALGLLTTVTADASGNWGTESLAIPEGFGVAATQKNGNWPTSVMRHLLPSTGCTVNKTLCFRWTTPHDFDLGDGWDPQPKTCQEIESEAILQEVQGQRQDLIDIRIDSLKNEYTNQCVKNLNDKLAIKHDLGTHHFTLYYYDRAGNLIQTVPPEGVRLLNVSTPTAVLSARSAVPAHEMKTTYQYNSLGQMVRQNTPDAGMTEFIYNDIGQLRFSQNSQQNADGNYSYTKYDRLGRIVEVGQAAEVNLQVLRNNRNNLDYPASGEQITRTVYTDNAPASILTGLTQRYLQNRVSYTYLDEDGSGVTIDDRTYTIYSYDPHGNVEWLVQNVPGLGEKLIGYEYDLLSGNVLQVNYSPGNDDEFHHKYEYDADNRITGVFTSRDGHLWDKDASYEYYPHGPLKRAIIGEDSVQNLDYVYTIHGWLKGINNPGSMAPTDAKAAADAFAMSLNYYNGDYQGISTTVAGVLQPEESRSLYNGNISAWETANRASDNSWMRTGLQYTYDELNRIKIGNFNVFRNDQFYTRGGFHSDYSYDANGNLKTLNRNDIDAETMDALVYHQHKNAEQQVINRLSHVQDFSNIEPDKHKNDVEYQNELNYKYDNIGNLIGDDQADMAIDWTVYGKVRATRKGDGTLGTSFKYDAAGNRVVKKTVDENGNIVTDFYVRDASGNIMAVYKTTEAEGTSKTELQEVPIYGNDRLGVFKPAGSFANGSTITTDLSADKQVNAYENMSYNLDENVKLTLQSGFVFEDGADGNGFSIGTASAEDEAAMENVYTRTLDKKQYELKDHLGNVRTVITDRKLSTVEGTTPTDFRPSIASASNYYPFGMDMPTVKWDTTEYLATMEADFVLDEVGEFENYIETRTDNIVFNHTDDEGAGTYSYTSLMTNGDVGLAKSLKIQAGDKINAEVYGKYLGKSDEADPAQILTLLTQSFLDAFNLPSTYESNVVSEMLTGIAPGTGGFATKGNDPEIRAYLNYILFDNNFEVYDAGFKGLSSAAEMSHERLSFDGTDPASDGIVPTKDGYIYIYLSNESITDTQTEVHFDDFKITHEHLVADEGYNADLIAYRYGFNGKEKDQNSEWTNEQIATSRPVNVTAYYPLDGDAEDKAPNALKGYLEGDVTATADRNGNAGKALMFDGAGDKVTINHNELLYSEDLTVSAWIKAPTQNVGAGVIVGKNGGGSTNQRGWLMSSPTTGPTDRLQVVVSEVANSSKLKLYYSSIAVFDDQWHHVAFTFADNELKLYIDGQEDTNVTKFRDDVVNLPYANTANLTIGWHVASDVDSKFFKGAIDEVGIFDRVFSAADIAALAADTNPLEISREEMMVAGRGLNNYDYGFRIYNPAIGKFLSVDPLTKSYPMLTPYQFASNGPIWAIDLDGLEAKIVVNSQYNIRRIAKLFHPNNSDVRSSLNEQMALAIAYYSTEACYPNSAHTRMYPDVNFPESGLAAEAWVDNSFEGVQIWGKIGEDENGNDITILLGTVNIQNKEETSFWGDLFDLLDPTGGKTRPATEWEKYVKKNINPQELKDLTEGLGARGDAQADAIAKFLKEKGVIDDNTVTGLPSYDGELDYHKGTGEYSIEVSKGGEHYGKARLIEKNTSGGHNDKGVPTKEDSAKYLKK